MKLQVLLLLFLSVCLFPTSASTFWEDLSEREKAEAIKKRKHFEIDLSKEIKPVNIEYDSRYSKGVTYSLSKVGRFGDCLVAHLHAKWLSYKYKLPFYIQSFEYSDKLAFSTEYSHVNTLNLKQYKLAFTSGLIRSPERNLNRIHVVEFFPECRFELSEGSQLGAFQFPYFEIDWSDQDFKDEALKDIQPRGNLDLFYPPKEALSVAVHVRQGGGFDTKDVFFQSPLKFPPLSFYIENIRKIMRDFPSEKLYLHLFTDSRNPELIAERIYQEIPEFSGEIGYRKSDNFHNKNVLEDFYSLFNFDCLIHPMSSYSILQGKLKDFIVEIYPENYRIVDGNPLVTETKYINRRL